MKALLLHIVCFIIIIIAIVLLGYVLVKKKAIIPAWFMLITSVLIVHFVFLDNHPIIRMLAIIATTFTAMKVIAVSAFYKNKKLSLTFKQWTFFAVGWAGMRAQPFETLSVAPLPNAWAMIRFGVSRVIVGFLLVIFAHWILAWLPGQYLIDFLVSALLLISFSLILHFGLLSISAGMWRLSGVDTYLLFRQPAKASSLTEFWSKRWNLAFSEMTSIAIYRPLKNKTGKAAALMLAFLFSGLLHELALSVPVNSGYGLPTLYFILQGIMVLIEKALVNHKNQWLHNRVFAKIWLFFWLVIPMPLLFHPQFIKQIVWPLGGLIFK